MKKALFTIFAALAVVGARAATMASQPWVSNRIAEAEARVCSNTYTRAETDAKITAATNAIPRAELPEYWPLYAVTNRDGTPVSSYSFDGLNINGIGATASDAWQMATDALSGLAGLAHVGTDATNYTDAVALEFERGTRTANNANFASTAITASEANFLLNDLGDQPYNATDLITESTNTARSVVREMSLGGIYDSELGVWWAPVMQNGALRYETNAVQNAADALATVSNVVASGGLASVDAVDAKISTNNAAFVSAVLAVPLTGADAGDLAEIAEYGGYGTVGAALLAIIAGLAALKRRMGTAETSLAQKANASDLPYRLVEPGSDWRYSGEGVQPGVTYSITQDSTESAVFSLYADGVYVETVNISDDPDMQVSLYFEAAQITATRTLPGHLLDRAGNRMVVSGDTTLTLPAANPGYLRDFLVRLEISGSTVPTITFAAPTGETLTYETDGDEFPVPDDEGTWLYSFTESCVAHKFAVSLKSVQTVAQGGS